MLPKLILRQNRPWSDIELQQIVDLLAAGMPIERVARKLKRTVPAVRVQATRLGVSATKDLKRRAERNQRRGHLASV